VAVVAALEATEALKILQGRQEEVLRSLVMIDVWNGDFERAETKKGSEPCPVCDDGQYELLMAERGSMATVLCGRNAVQLSPKPGIEIDLPHLAQRLADVGDVAVNAYLLRLEVEGYQLTLFPGGRAIVKGTDDPSKAKALYARYVGT
jgi:adenylyltransferase/sulfurtransferase